jgi:hypothetical protein
MEAHRWTLRKGGPITNMFAPPTLIPFILTVTCPMFITNHKFGVSPDGEVRMARVKQKLNEPLTPLREPIVVRGQGTRLGYFRPAKAFINMLTKLAPNVNSKNLSEPSASYRREDGFIELVYRWKEDELIDQELKRITDQELKRRKNIVN